MALVSCRDFDLESVKDCVKIARWVKTETHVEYTIELSFGGVTWTCQRRYRDFAAFDKQRFRHMKEDGATHPFLPPKKFVGNKESEFVESRRLDLEKYVRFVIELEFWLQKRNEIDCVPRPLAVLLDFYRYECHSILEELASQLHENELTAETIQEPYRISPLELWALTERTKMASPPCPSGDTRLDISSVLDFVHNLKQLKVVGCDGNVGSSTIRLNDLHISFFPFKSVEYFFLSECACGSIKSLDGLRATVTELVVDKSICTLSDLLECDISALNMSSLKPTNSPRLSSLVQSLNQALLWPSLRTASFANNKLTTIDVSIVYLRYVVSLDLSHNELQAIDHLHHLPHLQQLNLANNRIESLQNWNTKLGNLKKLNLANNRIGSLHGLRKLYSLEELDLTANRILQTRDIWPIGPLPCLVLLLLTDNPIQSAIEYRTRVLEAFRERASEMRLDGSAPSQREIDTVNVRLAIRSVREERERQIHQATADMQRRLDAPQRKLSPQDGDAVLSTSCS